MAVENLGLLPLALRRDQDAEMARILAMGASGGGPRILPASGAARSGNVGTQVGAGLGAIGGMLETFGASQKKAQAEDAARAYVADVLGGNASAAPAGGMTGQDLLNDAGMGAPAHTVGSVLGTSDLPPAPANGFGGPQAAPMPGAQVPQAGGGRMPSASVPAMAGAGEAAMPAPGGGSPGILKAAQQLDPGGFDKELWALAAHGDPAAFISYASPLYGRDPTPSAAPGAAPGAGAAGAMNLPPAARRTAQYLLDAGDPVGAAQYIAELTSKPGKVTAGELVKVPGPDGQPTYIPASQAAGRTAYERPRDPKADPLEWVTDRETGEPNFVPRSEVAASPGRYAKAQSGEVHFFDAEAERVVSVDSGSKRAREIADEIQSGSRRWQRQASPDKPAPVTLVHPKRPDEPLSAIPGTRKYETALSGGYYRGTPSQRGPGSIVTLVGPGGARRSVYTGDPETARMINSGQWVREGGQDVFDRMIEAAMVGSFASRGQGAPGSSAPSSATMPAAGSAAPSSAPIQPAAGGGGLRSGAALTAGDQGELEDARGALARGAPVEQVKAQLRALGIDPGALDSQR